MRYICCMCEKIFDESKIVVQGANSTTYQRYFCSKCVKNYNKKLEELNDNL
jgi:DNA-directed RNA polymerase subunit RPC12/RpoP